MIHVRRIAYTCTAYMHAVRYMTCMFAVACTPHMHVVFSMFETTHIYDVRWMFIRHYDTYVGLRRSDWLSKVWRFTNHIIQGGPKTDHILKCITLLYNDMGRHSIYQNVHLFIRNKNDILNAAVFKHSLPKVRETILHWKYQLI